MTPLASLLKPANEFPEHPWPYLVRYREPIHNAIRVAGYNSLAIARDCAIVMRDSESMLWVRKSDVYFVPIGQGLRRVMPELDNRWAEKQHNIQAA